MSAYPYLSNRTQVRGTWSDGVLTIWVPDDFTKALLNKPAVTEVVAKAASSRFGCSARVAFSVGTPPAEAAGAPAPTQEGPDALDALLDFGKFDNITIN